MHSLKPDPTPAVRAIPPRFQIFPRTFTPSPGYRGQEWTWTSAVGCRRTRGGSPLHRSADPGTAGPRDGRPRAFFVSGNTLIGQDVLRGAGTAPRERPIRAPMR